jgi:hypothetical protein
MAIQLPDNFELDFKLNALEVATLSAVLAQQPNQTGTFPIYDRLQREVQAKLQPTPAE